MAARLYLIRHGQTDWNKESVFRGRADRPLNNTGWKEARAVARALQGAPIAAVYASPLSRAMGTVKHLAEQRNMEVTPVEGVIDIDFGRWQGRPLDQVEAQEPEDFRRWLETPEKMAFPGGESLEQAALRSADAVRSLSARHGDQAFAVCTHRVICKTLICALLPVDLSRFWQIKVDTASISTLSFDGARWILEQLNADHHLADLAGERTTADF